jgi:hypothetical protein
MCDSHVSVWHRSLQRHLSLDFSLVGLSLYPHFLTAKADGAAPPSTFDNLLMLGRLARSLPGKRIYIAETAYPASGQLQPIWRFPATPRGQLGYLRAVLEAITAALPAEQRGGLLWWERNETGHFSLFDEDYVARPALLHGFRGIAHTKAEGGDGGGSRKHKRHPAHAAKEIRAPRAGEGRRGGGGEGLVDAAS